MGGGGDVERTGSCWIGTLCIGDGGGVMGTLLGITTFKLWEGIVSKNSLEANLVALHM